MNRLNRCVVNTQRRNLNLKENRAETKRIFFPSLFGRVFLSSLTNNIYMNFLLFFLFSQRIDLIQSDAIKRTGPPVRKMLPSCKMFNRIKSWKNFKFRSTREKLTRCRFPPDNHHWISFQFEKKKKLNKQTSKTIPTIMIKYHAFQVNAVNDVDNDGNKR